MMKNEIFIFLVLKKNQEMDWYSKKLEKFPYTSPSVNCPAKIIVVNNHLWLQVDEVIVKTRISSGVWTLKLVFISFVKYSNGNTDSIYNL